MKRIVNRAHRPVIKKTPASEKSQQAFKGPSSLTGKRVFKEMILADQRRREQILSDKVRAMKRLKKERLEKERKGRATTSQMAKNHVQNRDFFVGWQ